MECGKTPDIPDTTDLQQINEAATTGARQRAHRYGSPQEHIAFKCARVVPNPPRTTSKAKLKINKLGHLGWNPDYFSTISWATQVRDAPHPPWFVSLARSFPISSKLWTYGMFVSAYFHDYFVAPLPPHSNHCFIQRSVAVSCKRPVRTLRISRTSPARGIARKHLPSTLSLYCSIYYKTRKRGASQRSHERSQLLASLLAASSLSPNL